MKGFKRIEIGEVSSKYLGIDISEEYCRKATKRLLDFTANEQKGLFDK